MKLKNKIIIAFLSIGLLPLLLFGYFSLYLATKILDEQAFSKLEAVREIKENQIEEYFAGREADIVMLQHAVKALIFDEADSGHSKMQKADANHDYFAHYIEAHGYDDLLIVSGKGDVFYSVKKLSDYQTNVVTGPFEDSGLGRIFKSILGLNPEEDEEDHHDDEEASHTEKPDHSLHDFHIEDFSPYAANNNEPESFIAYPIKTGDEIDSVIVLKLSIDHINDLMKKRAGMGETGETYLIGSDHRMRSDSYLDPIEHSVAASFAGNIEDNGVETDAAEEAVQGKSGSKIVTNYNGDSVLSSYTPLHIHDLNWALIAEIDEAEAFAGVTLLRNMVLLVLLLTSIVIFFIAYRLVISIIKPIGGEPEQINHVARLIANGDLTAQFDENKDYSGIYHSMQKMSNQLNSMIGNINQLAGTLASGASQSSVAAEQVNITLSEQQKNIERVASAISEMSMTIQGVSHNAQQVADSSLTAKNSAADAKNHVQQTISSMTKLSTELEGAKDAIQTVDSKSQKIGAILEVIRGVADQTNLLALNAAIEAARAGEQGRGFSVVADEVRQLAQKTQLSTTDIEDMIQLLQDDVKNVVNVIQRSNDIAIKTVAATQTTHDAIGSSYSEVELISDNAVQIATASMQQSATTEEINQALAQINESAKQNSQGMGEISASSSHISQQSKALKSLSDQFKMR